MKIVKDGKITFVAAGSKEGKEEMARRVSEAEKLKAAKEKK